MNIFVGNLSFTSTEEDVKIFFSGYGTITSVVIVKDKKGKESRGFGFVEMSDEKEAQAAINALNDKEFMGRAIKVEASRPNTRVAGDISRKEKTGPGFKTKTQSYDLDNKSVSQDKPRVRPDFVRTGRYKEGRRTGSYIRRRLEAGIEEPVVPKRRFKENLMRWRKKREYLKPWQKNREETNPWQKKEGEFKPQEKAGVEFKPRRKSGIAPKPWQKNRGEAKPWQKKVGEFKPQEKAGVESKPRIKSGIALNSKQKSANRKKPFHFKERKSSGGYKRGI
jgi:RNA recognition motif-containing protein